MWDLDGRGILTSEFFFGNPKLVNIVLTEAQKVALLTTAQSAIGARSRTLRM